MKTMEEACRKFSAEGALGSYADTMKEVATCQDIYPVLLQVACMEVPQPTKLMMALALGIAIGIEMEKA